MYGWLVILLNIRIYVIYIVEVTPLQIQNFEVFVEIGIFVNLFYWPRVSFV